MAEKKSLGNFVRKLREDKDFRTKVGLYWGAVFNLIFAGVTLYSGIRYQSAWFVALGVCYLVLVIVKFYIGRSSRWRGSKKKWRVLKNSGIEMIDTGKDVVVGIEETTGIPIWSGAAEKILPGEGFSRDKIINDQTMEALVAANRITGVTVGAIVLGMTIYMIVLGRRGEKRLGS